VCAGGAVVLATVPLFDENPEIELIRQDGLSEYQAFSLIFPYRINDRFHYRSTLGIIDCVGRPPWPG
jgi:hypothetical protein